MTLEGHQRRDDGGGLRHSPGIASFQPVACYFRFLAFRFPQKSACNLVGLGTVLCNLYSSTTCHSPGWLAPMSKLSFTQHRCFSGVLYTNPNKISNTREIPQNYHILCINCFIPLNDPCFLQSFFFLFLPVAKLLISPRWWFRKGQTHQQVPQQLHRVSANFTPKFAKFAGKKDFFGANDGDMCCISRFQLRCSGEVMPPCPSWAQVAGKWFLVARLAAGFLTIRVRNTKKKKQFWEQQNCLEWFEWSPLYCIWLYIHIYLCVCVNVCNQYPLVWCPLLVSGRGIQKLPNQTNSTQSRGAPGIFGRLDVAIFASTRIWLMPMEIWRMEEAVLEKI